MFLQVEIDFVNYQVNVICEEFEEQNNKLWVEFDNFKFEVDIVKVKNEMFFEDVQVSKIVEIEEFKEKYQNDFENL